MEPDSAKQRKYKHLYKKYCCVHGCYNKTDKESELSFFNVPRDERREEWLKVIDREDLLDNENSSKYNYVCGVHFDDAAVITSISRRLKKDAIPTKILPRKSNTCNKLSDQPSRKGHFIVSTYSHTQIQTEPKILPSNNKEPNTDKEDTSNDMLQQKSIELIEISPSIDDIIEPCTSTENEYIVSKIKTEDASTSTDFDETITDLNNATLDVAYESLPHNDPKIEISVTDGLISNVQNDSQGTSMSVSIGCQETLNKDTDNLSDKPSNKRKHSLDSDSFDSKRCLREEDENSCFLSFSSESDVTQNLVKFVTRQNEIKKKVRSNSFDAYKMFLLNLYYSSPHGYRCLQPIMNLPYKSALKRLNFNIPPKLTSRVFDSLSLKIHSLPANAKYCAMCVNKVELKRNLYYDVKRDEVIGFRNVNGTTSTEVANAAYVIVLQGIYCNWTQPIAYAFYGNTENYDEIITWMIEVIQNLFAIGFKVKAINAEQGAFGTYMQTVQNVTVEKPYFLVNEQKIFFLFNVIHLLNSLRDAMLSNDFYFDEKKISWDYIKILYQHQKEKNLSLIPKITKRHIDPNDSQRKKIKYASEIFSDSVSAALETYIEFGKLTEDARSSAEFLKVINDLFVVLDSEKLKSVKTFFTDFSFGHARELKSTCAFKMSSEEKSVLRNSQKIFNVLKSRNHSTQRDNTNQIECFVQFQVTIESVIRLFKNLESDGSQYLYTSQLTENCLEEFCTHYRESAPVQFAREFSNLFHDSMLNNKHTVCRSDIFEMLFKAENIIDKQTLSPFDEPKPSLVNLDGEVDYRIDLPEENALTYLTSFLLYKCSIKHQDCTKLSKALECADNLNNEHYMEYNKYKLFYGKLKSPPKEINEYVQKLEIVFTRNFETYVHGIPGGTILKLLQEIPLPTLPCMCFPADYFLKLFVRLRIYATFKHNNRIFQSGTNVMRHYLQVRQL